MKVVAVLFGIFAGALISSVVIWDVGYQICEVIGVGGHEQPAYFTALVLWPLYALVGAITGGATMFAIIPGNREKQLQPKST
ncbi:MAG: hypothetical protein AAFQ82_14340 [Myxococcota bacterium]